MRFEFTDLYELDQFLEWATKYGRTESIMHINVPIDLGGAARAEDVSPDSPAYQAAVARAASAFQGKIVAAQLADNVPRAAPEAQQDGEPQTAQSPTAPRTKRRTKAEIEAATKAQAAAIYANASKFSDTPPDEAQIAAALRIGESAPASAVGDGDPVAPANPFAASTPAADAALDASQGKTGLTADVAGALPAPDAAEIAAKTAEYLANGDADNPMLHLTSSRHVMDKHGLDVYRSSLDGLPGNIVEHTREHRAEHMARLWALG